MKKIFLGIKGYIVCLDQSSGEELWRTKLRSSTITNVVFSGDSVHAYCRGHLYSLSSETGDVLWENELTGLGYGYCMIATEDSGNMMQAANVAQAQQTAVAVITAASAGAAASS